jgi:hypothetical protein
MITQISYNVLIDRFRAFAAGHYLIKQFTHGHPSAIDIEKGLTFPWMHVFPVEVEPRPGSRLYSFIVTFADLPRDKETPTEYEREIISDCIKLAEDLVAEIQNGLVLFGPTVELEGSPSIEVFIQEYSQTLTGVNLALTLSVPWDWSACDIPADWTVGGSGSGGTGSRTGLLLQTNGVNNGSQSLLNLQQGTNVTITDNGNGTVTISASGGGGGGSGTVTSVGLSVPAPANPALSVSGSPVTASGTIAITANGDASEYIDGTGALQTFPTIPDVSSFVPYTGATQNVDLGTHSLTADNGTNNSEINPSYFGVQNTAGTKYSLLEKDGLTVTDSVAGDAMNVNAGGLTFPDATSQYTAAVNADWNAVGGLAEILNKPPIPVNLDDLGDVNAPTPANGQVLAFNSTSGDWEPITPASGGSVTSVGLTMPSAFTVSGSPVTTAGTLAVTGAGLATQYVRGDGQLANFPITGGGGSSVSYYLNGSINQGTIGGSTYYQMSKTAVFGAGTDFTRTNAQGNGLIAQFITDVNDPNVLLIPGGNFNLEFYFNASSGGGTPSFYVELYKYDGAAFTLLATDVATPEGITQGTVIDAYFTALAVPPTVMTLSDRLALRVFVTTSGRTLKLHTENGHLCQVITTLSTGVNAINGLTAQVQNLATGTAGSDFGINSTGSTHTFNLPTASASNRGALSSADWSTFNSKQNSIGLTTVGTALATLPDPSAVRYLRINAGNTVTALTLAELKADLGIGSAVVSSDFATTGTSYQNVTSLAFTMTAGKTYKWRATIWITSTSTGSFSTNGPSGTTIYRYTMGSGTTTNLINNGTANNTGTAVGVGTNRIVSADGIYVASANGTFNVSVISSSTGGVVVKAGSILEFEEVA